MLRKSSLKKLLSQKFKVENGRLEAPRKEYAVISAEKHNESPVERRHRTQQLDREIMQEGYKPIRATGAYIEKGDKKPIEEASFIVPGMSLARADVLGKQFGQEAVLENNIAENVDTHGEELFGGRLKYDTHINPNYPYTKVKAKDEKVAYQLSEPVLKLNKGVRI